MVTVHFLHSIYEHFGLKIKVKSNLTRSGRVVFFINLVDVLIKSVVDSVYPLRWSLCLILIDVVVCTKAWFVHFVCSDFYPIFVDSESRIESI